MSMFTKSFNLLAQSLVSFAVCQIFMNNYVHVHCESFLQCPSLSHPPEVTIVDQNEKFTSGTGELLYDYILNLKCVAAYPIYWDFIPPEFVQYRTESKVAHENSHHKSKLCYQESLIVKRGAGSGRTGNYTCKSALDQNVATWKYLYIRDKTSLFVANPKETILYSELINGTEWSIPCLGNVENFSKIHLYKEKEDGILKELNTSLRYDSKYGFLLNTQTRPEGTFHCNASLDANYSTSREPDYVVYAEYDSDSSWNSSISNSSSNSDGIKVELKNYNAMPAKNFVEYKTDYSFTVICEFDEEIILEWPETNGGGLKVIDNSTQKNQSFKHSVRYVFQAADALSRVKKGIINCVVAKSKNVLHYWNYDFRNICNCTAVFNRYEMEALKHQEEDITPTLECTGLWKPPSIKYNSCEGPTKLNLVERYFNKLGNFEIATYYPRDRSYAVSGNSFSVYNMKYTTSAIFCTVENFTTVTTAISTLNGYEMNPKRLNLTANLQIDVSKQDGSKFRDHFIGDTDITELPSIILCSASRYYFSSPMRLAIQMKNGTKHAIKEDFTESFNDWGIFTKAAIVMTPEIKSITCFAPLWNSTEWKTVEMHGEQPKIEAEYKIWEESKRCDESKTEPVIILKRIHPDKGRQHYLKMHDVSNAELSLETEDLTIILFCRATFPIQWHGDWQSQEISIHAEEMPADNSKLSPCFEIKIEINAYHRRYAGREGEFICSSQANHSINTSLYIYPNPEDRDDAHLLKEGKQIFANFYPDEDVNTIPCKVNRPSALVEIFSNNKGEFKKLLAGKDYVKYNPRKGFLIKTSMMTKKSQYICSLANETNPQKKVLVSFNAGESDFDLKCLNEANASRTTSNTTDFFADALKSLNVKDKYILSVLIVVTILVGLLLGVQTWLIRKQYITDQKKANALGNFIELEHN